MATYTNAQILEKLREALYAIAAGKVQEYSDKGNSFAKLPIKEVQDLIDSYEVKERALSPEISTTGYGYGVNEL